MSTFTEFRRRVSAIAAAAIRESFEPDEWDVKRQSPSTTTRVGAGRMKDTPAASGLRGQTVNTERRQNQVLLILKAPRDNKVQTTTPWYHFVFQVLEHIRPQTSLVAIKRRLSVLALGVGAFVWWAYGDAASRYVKQLFAPRAAEFAIPATRPGNHSGMMVLVSGFPNDRDGQARKLLIDAVEQESPGVAQFGLSPIEGKADSRVLAELKAAAQVKGASLFLWASQEGTKRLLHLVPVASSKVIPGDVSVGPLVGPGRQSEAALSRDVSLLLRAARAERDYDRGLTNLAVQELENLLEEESHFPKGISAGELHSRLARVMAMDTASSPDRGSEALVHYTSAINAFKRSGRISDYRATLIDKALLFQTIGEASEAVKTLDKALDDFQFNDDPLLWIQAVVNRALAVAQLGEQGKSTRMQAIADLEYARRYRPGNIPSQMVASLDNTLGLLYVQSDQGDGRRLDLALPLYEESLEIFAGLCKYDPSRSYCLSAAAVQGNFGRALTLTAHGDREANLERAGDLFTQALRVRTREADFRGWATTEINLARAFLELGRLKEDQIYIEASVNIAEDVVRDPSFHKDVHLWAVGEEMLAEAHSAWRGDNRRVHLRRAEVLYEHAAQLYESVHDRQQAAKARAESTQIGKLLGLARPPGPRVFVQRG